MPNLSYLCIFTLSIDLEGPLLDPSNGMLQIAAYLQHICCTWQFLKNYECSKDETQNIVFLESNYTSYQMLQQPEVLLQYAAATRSAAAMCCKIA